MLPAISAYLFLISGPNKILGFSHLPFLFLKYAHGAYIDSWKCFALSHSSFPNILSIIFKTFEKLSQKSR